MYLLESGHFLIADKRAFQLLFGKSFQQINVFLVCIFLFTVKIPRIFIIYLKTVHGEIFDYIITGYDGAEAVMRITGINQRPGA